MQYLKKFNEEFINTNPESEKGYWETFEKYVKGQKIVDHYATQPYINGQKLYCMSEGVELENGYKFVSYGGMVAGKDCNFSYILNENDEVVASLDRE